MDLSLKEMTLITVLDSVDITKFTIDGFLEVSNLKEKEFEEIADSIFENYSKDLKVLELGQKYYKNFPEYLRGAKEYQHSWEEENELQTGTKQNGSMEYSHHVRRCSSIRF